jgi:methyl-accepting chemotaxis protein
MDRLRSISARLVLAISLTVAVACLVLGAFSVVQQRSLTALALDEQLKLQYDSIVAAIDYEGRAAVAISTLVAKLPPVADALANGDRDALMRLLGTGRSALQAQGIPRMMFALPPATAFLRVQDPKDFGDDISGRRTTIVLANKQGHSVGGVEMGPKALAIYGMTPVMRDGKSLGAVDIGVAFGKEFVDAAKARFGVDLAVHNYDGKSFSTLAATFAGAIATEQELKAVLDGARVRREVALDGHSAALYLGQIRNYSGQPVGVVELVKDTTAFATAAAAAQQIFIGGGTAILVAAILVAVLLGRSVSRPLIAITGAMERLSGGDTKVAIPGNARRDELGTMAKAVHVFKENAIAKLGLEEAQRIDRDAMARRQEEINQLIGFFGRSMSGSFRSLSGVSAEMSRTSTSLENAAQTTGSQATVVLGEVGQTAENIQSVAAASQELSASIAEIGRQAGESARGSSAAMQQAAAVVTKVEELREAASAIGSVVELINSIAGQTNLLALNATIEAARAGEAGRGFAVVAGEVKALAAQTAKATSDIAHQVASIQSATGGAAAAIEEISGTVRGVNETAVAIATAVEQQDAATREIARSIESVTVNAASMARGMEQVQRAVGVTGDNAAEVRRTTLALSVDTGSLSAEVQDFLAALSELGEIRQLHVLDVDLPASAVVKGQSVPGRVTKVSPGMALFDGPLEVMAGTLVELRVETLDRPLHGRFVDRAAGGCRIQLLLNQQHLSFMEALMTRLALAA